MDQELLVYKSSHSQQRSHFSSADVRKETRNGALSRAYFFFGGGNDIYTGI